MLRPCLGACKQAVCDNAAGCMTVEHKDGFVESARHSQACRNGTQHALHALHVRLWLNAHLLLQAAAACHLQSLASAFSVYLVPCRIKRLSPPLH